jgi:oligopeptidase B
MEAPEEVLLDVNELAKGTSSRRWAHGREPRRHRLAYTVDFIGFRQYTLHVKDLATAAATRDTPSA